MRRHPCASRQPEVAGTQRGRGAVGIGVVESQAPLEHIPVRLHFCEGAGESRVAGVAARKLRLAACHHAKCPRADDPSDEISARPGVQQPRLIVVGIRCEERVTCRQVEQALVPLQFLIAEDPEGGVAGPESLDHRGGPLAEHLSFVADPVPFGQQPAIATLGVLEFLQTLVDAEQSGMLLPQEISDGSYGCTELQIQFSSGNLIEFTPPLSRLG